MGDATVDMTAEGLENFLNGLPRDGWIYLLVSLCIVTAVIVIAFNQYRKKVAVYKERAEKAEVYKKRLEETIISMREESNEIRCQYHDVRVDYNKLVVLYNALVDKYNDLLAELRKKGII